MAVRRKGRPRKHAEFDDFFASMAVTIMGGLAFATILTLIAAPVLYSLFLKRSAEKAAAAALA